MFISLVSGSSGNCSLVSDGKTSLLIDCGLSCKKLEEALAKAKLSPLDLSAILITHEHSDHIKGAGVVSKKYSLPVFATAGTHAGMNVNIDSENIRYLSPDVDLEIGSIGIRPFQIPHDAANPVGYNFFCGKNKLSLATDIGTFNDYIFENLKGSLAVLLEANYDENMLKFCRYPAYLKRRISGALGHLSNPEAADAAVRLASTGTRHIMLGHLSKENNTPTAAYTTVLNAFSANGVELNKDVALSVASRFEVSCFK